MKPKILILLGADYNYPVHGIYQYLPQYLSKFYQTYVLEYPRFKKLAQLFTKQHLVQKINNNLTIFHSIAVLPFGKSFYAINWINHKVSTYLAKERLFPDQKNFNKIVSLTPEVAFFDHVTLNNISLYYYVIDDYYSHPTWKGKKAINQLKRLEKKTLKIAKKVIVSSNKLYSKYKTLHKNVVYFESPSNSKPFLKYKYLKHKTPPDFKNIPHPIVGFIGSFYRWRIDKKLLDKFADYFTNFSFVFIGHMKNEDKIYFKNILGRRNCYFLGLKDFDDLPSYVASFDVCIIPYKLNNYGLFCFPTKIYEYLAMGKPVVTTGLPAIEHLGKEKLIYWSKSTDEFKENLKRSLAEKQNGDITKERKQQALKNSWEKRIRDFIDIISN